MFPGVHVVGRVRGTLFGPDPARVFDELTAALNEPIATDAQRLGQAISFRATAPPQFVESIIQTLIDSILHQHRVVINYWTASREVESRRKVDPYHT